MTDLAPSSLTQSQFTGASGFDASRYDANIQQISTIERTWRLPTLPEEVKHDLASLPGVDPEGLSSLLGGIEEALDETPPPEPDIEDELDLLVPRPTLSGIDQARIILADLSSNPSPRTVDEDAVRQFKADAIRAGLLDMDPSKIDNSWSPELNRLRGEMAFDRYNSRMRGHDRFGAVPLTGDGDSPGGLMKVLNDFTSPSGLLAAATELDLWFDAGAISREWSTWGDKWRKVGDSKNPLDFAKNLVDAVTGPLDDVLVPVVNLGLMFMGVGAAVNTARVTWMGARAWQAGRAFKAADAFSDLYRTSRLGRLTRAGKFAENWDELGRASGLAQRLQRQGGALGKAGNAMESWRSHLGVRSTKSFMQSGMRLGMAQEAEQYLPGYQGGGFSLSDIETFDNVRGTLEGLAQDPRMILPEVMVAPYNIWEPGTFLRGGILSKAGRGALNALGTAGGRAAVGAGLGAVGGTIAGDDAGDIFEGAALGAAAAAAAPRVGGLLQRDGVPTAVKVAATALGGYMLGDSPEDALMGGLAGVGLFALPDSVRHFYRKNGARALFGKQFGPARSTKILQGLGAGLEMLSFKPITEHNHITMSFDRGFRAGFEQALARGGVDDATRKLYEDKFYKYQSDVRELGVRKAYANFMEVDEETAAASITYVYLSAMIDEIAREQAQALSGPWRGRHLQARNKLISQLRSFDVTDPTGAVLDDIATAVAYTELPETADRIQVMQRAKELRIRFEDNPVEVERVLRRHNDVAQKTLEQLISPTNLPADDGSWEGTMMLVGDKKFASLDMEGRGRLLEEYMPQAWDSLLNWPKYTEVLDEMSRARLNGLFDPAVLRPAKNRTGRPSRITDVGRRVRRGEPIYTANKAITDEILNNSFRPEQLDMMHLDVAAPSVLPGRLTLGRKESKFGQDLFELRERVLDVLDAKKHLDKIAPEGLANTLRQQRLRESLGESDDISDVFKAKRLKALIKDLPHYQQKSAKYLVGFAKRHGIDLDDLRATVTRMADELEANAELWDEYGLPLSVANDKGLTLTGFDALQRRAADLQEMIKYTAKEVDVDALRDHYRRLRGVPGTEFTDEAGATLMRVESMDAELEELERVLKHIDDAGYKLVHGVEFLQPEDLAADLIRTEFFADATQRHMNYATLGNFFRGRLPVEARIAEDIRWRGALTNSLSDLDEFKDVAPDSEEITGIINLLQDWLTEYQDDVAKLTQRLDLQTRSQRFANRLRSSTTPVRLDDIQNKQGEILQLLRDSGYSEEAAMAIWKAIPKMRNQSFRDLGLYAFEARARAGNQAAWALKTLGSTKYATKRGFVGGFVGATVGAYEAQGGDENQALGGALIGGAAGAAVGALGGNLLGKTKPFQKLTAAAENWRYGYLADELARMRDSLRFTLSPFFDASRYTEGMMLAQTGAPLRRADGSRVVLPLNMSPRGLRRSMRKELMKEGLKGAELDDAVNSRYQKWISQFQDFARSRRDFDPDALDATGRWFKQVGILGFSPTDWMGTAFAHLMKEGFGAEEAYDAVRSMYTYGTRGRSGAEMSVNYILFPFSFQKKAMKHLAQWMNDDLGRSIMIHDALKTYELLDERYDLDNRWREHFPMFEMLNRLNLFAYGLSPGRLGGINSQLFESAGKVAWNAFVPVGLQIRDASAEKEIQDVMRNMLPVLNDINWMIEDLKDTREVVDGLWDDVYLTRRAEITRGYEELEEFRQEFEAQLAERGYKLADIHNKPWLADLAAIYKQKEAEIADRYPEWFRYRNEYTGNQIALREEGELRRERFNRAIAEGREPSRDDAMYAEFSARVEELQRRLQLLTGSPSLTNADSEVYAELQRMAAQMARENPGFVSLYNKYWAREFGPIERIMSL